MINLDTHILIWFISGDEQLSLQAKELTGNKETQRHKDTKKEIKSKLCLEIENEEFLKIIIYQMRSFQTYDNYSLILGRVRQIKKLLIKILT